MTKAWLVPFVLLLLVSSCMQPYCVHGESQVPGFFIFGDSLSDSGNNNYLINATKANYKPYGIDFPLGPTGRFTNGRTFADIIGQFLGFEKFIPPFANTSGSDILKGVNYASGCAGIRVETGTHMGPDISLGQQVSNHRVIVSQIAKQRGGSDRAMDYLQKCLYFVSIGSNDYINNYFVPQSYSTSRNYNPRQYAQTLIDQLSKDLESLRDMGARKFVMVGLGFLGCTPGIVLKHKTNNGSCVQEINAAGFVFNEKLKALVDNFNDKFSADSKFIFINTTYPGAPQNLDTCCATGEDGMCLANGKTCENRKKLFFFDQFHSTESTNQLFAMATYNTSNLAYTYPMDVKQLAESQPTAELHQRS